MAHVIARVEVEDFDRFISVFRTKGAELRASHGSRGSQVFRGVGDSNEVTVVFDWDPDEFEGFLADPKAQEAMSEAGLKGPPQPAFVEHVTDVES